MHHDFFLTVVGPKTECGLDMFGVYQKGQYNYGSLRLVNHYLVTTEVNVPFIGGGAGGGGAKIPETSAVNILFNVLVPVCR